MTPETTKKRRNTSKNKFKSMGDHSAFLSRIKKSLYYGRLPSTERLSLPVTELATELFSAAQRKRSLQRLELQEAANLSRSACVSPCSLVLALLYLERLQTCRPSYLRDTPPSELYLVSLMVATKFLQDDGEEDGVVNEEWATSAGITTVEMNKFERDFLDAIDWEVYVNEEAFWTRLRGVERYVALSEGARRGWFSYTDLDALLEKADLVSLAHTVLMVCAVCLTSYTASVLTLVASALLVSQLQPLVGSFSGISQMNVIAPAMPLTPSPVSPVDLPIADLSDSTSRVSHLPADVLTTSFILASISSCGEAYGNATQDCDGQRPEIMSTHSNKPLLILNRWLTNLDRLGPLQDMNDSWHQRGPKAWSSWIKYIGSWLQVPLPGEWGLPPDWATSLSYSLGKNPGATQAGFFPIQVY